MASSGILVTQFNYAKLFIGNNHFRTATYQNLTGVTVELTKGMIIGRIWGSGKVKQSVSTATDGSQIPIGILQNDYSVATGTSVVLSFCVSGDVAREGIVFAGADAYTTLVDAGYALDSPPDSPPGTLAKIIGPMEDVLWWKGIYPVATTENTRADNA